MPLRSPREGARSALTILALGLIAVCSTAVCSRAQAADARSADTTGWRPGPFAEIPLATPPPAPSTWSYGMLFAGAVLTGSSFVIADRADDAYNGYLRETDPDQFDRLFNRAVLYDRLSSGSLLAGETLMCLGLYWRFLRRPPPGLRLAVGAGGCAISYRF